MTTGAAQRWRMPSHWPLSFLPRYDGSASTLTRIQTAADFMQRFHGDLYFGLGIDLDRLARQALAPQVRALPVDPRTRRDADRLLGLLCERCEVADLPFTLRTVERLVAWMQGPEPLTFGDLGGQLCTLGERLEDELRTHVLLRLEAADRARFEQPMDAWGQAVADAFPEAIDDCMEASRCRALDRHTACVLHCMRAVEIALRALGQRYGVRLDDAPTWGELLQRLAAVRADLPTDRPADRDFLAGLEPHLRTIKNLWRNPAMHAVERYDRDTAAAIFDTMVRLLRHLAGGPAGDR